MNYSGLFRSLENSRLAPYLDALNQALEARCTKSHGDEQAWQQALVSLPDIAPDIIELDTDTIRIGSRQQLELTGYQQLEQALRQLHPWRKGPFELFGLHIDTEWHSDWKWQRLVDHVAPLKNRWVLDVGCGNGYHALRARGAGAARVIGIDPSLLFNYQYAALHKYIGNIPVDLLPLALEDFPANTAAFDTVFSMGVLYHRRSPLDHLLQLQQCLRPGGQLILETLVIEGGPRNCLVPGERYARMRNVWFLPSPDMLLGWLNRLGFADARVVDINITSTDEQRSTDWMRFESLADCLDQANPTLTVESYPRPARALVIAEQR
ncbi:MAG: tRNA 5-methoxyuridine(34)/uridine 5-oxyacetic acid(34) synthase CmoB [Gammaproteobacteria bacterium]|nr:tRNA 5-methoxyuridine(34)/uridine 5-oxyacetic acid(34) synthase CmoB [Gammaproteobacteria bacterium]